MNQLTAAHKEFAFNIKAFREMIKAYVNKSNEYGSMTIDIINLYENAIGNAYDNIMSIFNNLSESEKSMLNDFVFFNVKEELCLVVNELYYAKEVLC